MRSQFHWIVISVSCTESEDIASIRPSLLVPGLNDNLVFCGGIEAIKYKIASVCESIGKLGCRVWIFNLWNNICPLDRLLAVGLGNATRFC